MHTPRTRLTALSLLLLAIGLVAASPRARAAWSDPAEARRAMVATAHPLATQAGQAVLAVGGNAVDAAVAVSLALGVVEPWSSGIGGGGFMVVHVDGETTTWDFREEAPAAATRDMFVEDGEVVEDESTWSPRAAAIPGQVRGLVAVLDAHGSLPLEVVAAPAISLARHGFLVSRRYAMTLGYMKKHMNPAARRVFLDDAGSPPEPGARLRQPDLARTLERIVETKGEAFYTGDVAEEMVRAVRDAGGLWTMEDLARYRPKRRTPVRGTYRGYDVASMGMPSSGGLLLVQMLGVLGGFDLAASGPGSAETVHLLAETMKRAYAMRAEGMGDPDFINADRSSFVGDDVVERIRGEVEAAERATPAEDIGRVEVKPSQKTHTSHFSILTGDGDGVACTQTINLWFGNGMVAGDTGVVLNNEMDDFSAMPGAPNAFGLVGGEDNAIAGRKRPLSSMTPTLLLRDGKAVGAFGSPGGARIITTTLQALLNVVDHGMNVSQAVGFPRVHHQWYPDELRVEPYGPSPDTKRLLEERGHPVVEKRTMGNAMAVWRTEDGLLTGAADPRREGSAAGLDAVTSPGVTYP
ncbi:MAG: gamma-glutamyltransferase [Myxococcota bacterium]